MVLGKQASCLRIVGSRNPDPKIAALEEELRELGNSIGSVDEIALIRDTINHYGPVFIASLSIQIRRAGVRCLFRRTPCRLFRRAGECRLRPPKPPEIPGSLDRDVLRSLADRELPLGRSLPRAILSIAGGLGRASHIRLGTGRRAERDEEPIHSRPGHHGRTGLFQQKDRCASSLHPRRSKGVRDWDSESAHRHAARAPPVLRMDRGLMCPRPTLNRRTG
jgi:hypothetical protein